MLTRASKRARLTGPEEHEAIGGDDTASESAGTDPSETSEPEDAVAIDFEDLCAGVVKRPLSLPTLVDFVASLPPPGTAVFGEDLHGLVCLLCEHDLWMPLRLVLKRFRCAKTLTPEEAADMGAYRCAVVMSDQFNNYSLNRRYWKIWMLLSALKRSPNYASISQAKLSLPCAQDEEYLCFYPHKELLQPYVGDPWAIVSSYWLPPVCPDNIFAALF